MIFIVVLVCLVVLMIVFVVVVVLCLMQVVNVLKDKQINILQVVGIYDLNKDVLELFVVFELQIFELVIGEFIDQFDIVVFDDCDVVDDLVILVVLDDDLVGIGCQGKFVIVYLLCDDVGEIDKVILLLYGYGFWFMFYGFIVLEENGNDIFGLQFYEYVEIPGLGVEVDNLCWKVLWNGKKLVDEFGELQISVIKVVLVVGVDYYIDVLVGVMLIIVGVYNFVNFWMGEIGY